MTILCGQGSYKTGLADAAPVGASLLARSLRTPRGVRLQALSFTSIASKLAPTGGVWCFLERRLDLDPADQRVIDLVHATGMADVLQVRAHGQPVGHVHAVIEFGAVFGV